jgi:hypothetical protein
MLSRLCESMVFGLRENMLSQRRESMAPGPDILRVATAKRYALRLLHVLGRLVPDRQGAAFQVAGIFLAAHLLEA